ncbi:MAG: cytochrome c [Planctomycetes bacterium]|nr:cytochrome c [Planctomycetota bacterium]
MRYQIVALQRIAWLIVFVCGIALLAGCSAEARFRLNAAFQRKMENELSGPLGTDDSADMEEFRFTDSQIHNISDILEGTFGTPDDPFFPAVYDDEGNEIAVVDRDRLRMAAGAVGKDETGQERGLYRKHCAHCHGITGDGFGPTAAFLNPYPRDYRLGKFKFKSTPIGAKPTDDDLMRLLNKGIAGTAMPSFFVLKEFEKRALIDYVKYLSIRGEVERRLTPNRVPD